MQTVYVNRNTGEIFNATEVSLNNLCEGWVNSQFVSDLSLLAKRMVNEDKGCITIKIAVGKTYDGEGAEVLVIGATSELTLPKVKMEDKKMKHINEDGVVLEKEERSSLFDNLPQITDGTIDVNKEDSDE